jgi:hypothetical protein
MTEPDESKKAVEKFLRERIDTVPHLEALLLVWTSRPKVWSVEDIARFLYVRPDAAGQILADLARQQLIAVPVGAPESYHYDSDPDRDRLIAAVDATYRRDLVRVSQLIHSKPSAAVRAFADAFRLKEDKQ